MHPFPLVKPASFAEMRTRWSLSFMPRHLCTLLRPQRGNHSTIVRNGFGQKNSSWRTLKSFQCWTHKYEAYCSERRVCVNWPERAKGRRSSAETWAFLHLRCVCALWPPRAFPPAPPFSQVMLKLASTTRDFWISVYSFHLCTSSDYGTELKLFFKNVFLFEV